MPAATPPEEIAARVERIRTVAMDLFAERGYAATSMAVIAQAAGLSRPALYEHFENREDIFRAGLEHLLTEANTEALAHLEQDGPIAERFASYLQRCRGDVIGPLLASPHGDELLETRLVNASDVAERLHDERRQALRAALARLCEDGPTADRVTALLELGPLGLKHDRPSLHDYRDRLNALADAAASLVSDPVR